MSKIKIALLILFFPIWGIFYTIAFIGMWAKNICEILLDIMDSLVD